MRILGTSLRDLYREREGKRKRESSYDKTGGNFDFYMLNPMDKKVIFNQSKPGCITHIWITMAAVPEMKYVCLERKLVIRMFWDNEDDPSVEAPIGDFFGLGHGISKNFVSAPLAMCPQNGMGYNCFFPMPYNKGAKIEIQNEHDGLVSLYFYVDFEEYNLPVDSDLRFHARWKREKTVGINQGSMTAAEFSFSGYNTTGEKNYVILDARGKGHYVGCNLNIHNLRYTDQENWFGEGDDMIFIDDEPWPPRLHGTGTEDYFNTAFCPQQEYNSPYSGIILGGGPNWSGKSSFYRYHIEDPIMFEKSIKVTIEHGHNNHRSDDYSSTAYWYQNEPHMKYPSILPVVDRLPILEGIENMEELIKLHEQRDIVAEGMGIEEGCVIISPKN